MAASRKSNYPAAVALVCEKGGGGGMPQGAGLWAWPLPWLVATQINIVKTLVKWLNNGAGTWSEHGALFFSKKGRYQLILHFKKLCFKKYFYQNILCLSISKINTTYY